MVGQQSEGLELVVAEQVGFFDFSDRSRPDYVSDLCLCVDYMFATLSWRYDGELQLLNRLWELVSLRLNFFTPTRKAVGYTTTAAGRRKRVYDKPATPWQRLRASGLLDAQQLSNVATRIEGINPADLTRQINTIQMQLLDLAKAKTEALAAARHIDLQALQPSINRLAKAR